MIPFRRVPLHQRLNSFIREHLVSCSLLTFPRSTIMSPSNVNTFINRSFPMFLRLIQATTSDYKVGHASIINETHILRI